MRKSGNGDLPTNRTHGTNKHTIADKADGAPTGSGWTHVPKLLGQQKAGRLPRAVPRELLG